MRTFHSWWHEGGPTEKLVVLRRINPRIGLEELKRQDDIDAETVKLFKPKGRTSAVLLGGAQRGAGEDDEDSPSRDTAAGRETETPHVTPNASKSTPPPTPPQQGGIAGSVTGSPMHCARGRRRPASARRADEEGKEVPRWMRPMRRRVPQGKDIYWQMFEQNIIHKPYAPVKGSPLEQKPTVTPRKKKEEAKDETPTKPLHLMSWDERLKEQERLKKLAEKKPEILRAPSPPKDPGNDWTPMNDLFEKETVDQQRWKQIKFNNAKRPQTARPFGASSSPRNFLWNVAAGSKLLPGGTVGTPQHLENLEMASHLERMQLERRERQKRLAQHEELRKKAAKKEKEVRQRKIESGELKIEETVANVPDPRKQLIPNAVFVEALLEAFKHFGVEFNKRQSAARVAKDSSIIPMLPAEYQPNRHVPDDGHLCPTDGRRMVVPKEVKDVGVFTEDQWTRSNHLAFLGAHGRWARADPEPTREQQALWKNQLYP